MAEEFFQDRTERATPRKREEARRQGRVARSPEIAHAVVLLALTGVLATQGPAFVAGCRDLFTYFLGRMGALDLTPQGIVSLQTTVAPAVLALVAPIALGALASGLAANLLQVGLHVSGQPLTPKLDRIDPFKGARRIFSPEGGVELLKALLKVAVIGWVAWGVVGSAVTTLLPATGGSGGLILEGVGRRLLSLGLRVGLALLVLAILDYGYQRWRFERSLMMSRAEMEEELKHEEGSPQVKARLRALQRQMRRRRMMTEVPKADVVVVNPTHVAVALRYERGAMQAPVVVAKGMRRLAAKIRELAETHRIPVVQDPPLARTLYKEVDVGQPIPVALFEAVARVLAHVYRLHQAARRSEAR